MIDIHCHILPGLDDGAADIDAALAMAERAIQDGITTIVATPHAFAVQWDTRPEARDQALAILGQALEQAGLALQLLPGADCHLTPELLPALSAGPQYGIAGSTSHFLLELPLGLGLHALEHFLFKCQVAGCQPILTHPERHQECQTQLAHLGRLVERGLRLQITAGSLTGDFGRPAQYAAEHMLGEGWATFLASDAHDPEIRAPILSAGLRAAERLVGPAATQLVTANPQDILIRE